MLLWLLAPLLAAAQEPLRLEPGERMLRAAGHLQWLRDDTRAMSAMQAAASTAWVDLPANVNAGYTDAAIWLRLQLDAAQPGYWMLLFSNPLLDSVQTHIHRPPGIWEALGASGEDIARAQWPVDFRSPAVGLNLRHAGMHTVLIRITARNAIKTQVDVWQRLAFDNQTRRQGLFSGMYLGFYTLLVCLHALFWLATRARLSGLFVAYIGVCVLNEVLSLGLLQQITGIPGAWSDRLLGTSLPLAVPIATWMATHQLQLRHSHPRLNRWLLAATQAAALASMALVHAGHFAWGLILVQVVAVPTLLLLTGMALWLLREGRRSALFFLITFGPFHASVFIAFTRNLNLVPINAFTENISLLGTMVHMVLLSLWIVGGYVRQRRAHEREQMRLQAELAQRQQREGELLRTLELERRVRQEQRDFVAMVSHEFRTPLAVISTSAQQLARNLGAPPEKTLARSHNIRAAVQRLLHLVDDYLADDRLAEPAAAPHNAPCDLHALLADLCADFPPGRINCQYGDGTRHLVTDAELLRIALRNLLANADRHAPPGATVQVRAWRSGQRLHIDVANPAAAIPPEEQAHLFERYWRGADTQRGTGAGLGLYLVRRIAEKLGGSVALVSAGGDQPVCLRVKLSAENCS